MKYGEYRISMDVLNAQGVMRMVHLLHTVQKVHENNR